MNGKDIAMLNIRRFKSATVGVFDQTRGSSVIVDCFGSFLVLGHRFYLTKPLDKHFRGMIAVSCAVSGHSLNSRVYGTFEDAVNGSIRYLQTQTRESVQVAVAKGKARIDELKIKFAPLVEQVEEVK